MRTWLTILVYILSFSAWAEYRVFVLKIDDKTTGQSREVTSILDDIQYPEYYPVSLNERVSISQTWKCLNRSDISQDIEQKYCANPHPPAAVAPGTATSTGQNRAPASLK